MAAVSQLLLLQAEHAVCVSVFGHRLVLPASTQQSPRWLENTVVLELPKESHTSLLLIKLKLVSR